MIELVEKRLQEATPQRIEGTISTSDKKEFGHYTSNVAFKLAKEMKKSPFEVAQDLAKNLSSFNEFKKVEAIAPGFINFWISSEILQDSVKKILKEKKSFGKSKVKKSKKINIEFVSANPTGPLTMANGRGGFYGDVLSNVLESVGHKVTREYYVNDAGNQVRLLGESIKAVEGKIEDKEEYYKGDYIKKLKGKTAKQAIAILLKEIKKSLKKAGINQDVFFSEDKNLHKKDELNKVLKFLKKKKMIVEKDGALWLGDNVLVKSDGNPTYFLADLAYHYDKLIKRKFDLAIDIWGADHHGYISRMKEGVKALGINPDRLEILITQLIRLVSGGKEVRMSKRKGNFVTMDDLINRVGVDVTRFFFLMHSANTHMDFDLDLAKEKSQKNPVYYTQYAYVRCLNILKKGKISNNSKLELLKSDSEIKLMLELVKFPDIISQTAKDYQVHRLTKYASELARSLHYFYESEKVVGVEKDLESARLDLVNVTKIVFENLFKILKISSPKKM